MKWLFGLGLVFFVTTVSDAQTIAVVDPQRIVQTSEIGKKALSEIKALKVSKQAEINAMKNTDRQKAMRLSQDAENEIQKRLGTSIKEIENKVLPIIKTLATNKGYAVVLQKDQTAYYDPKLDITDEVIRLLNSKP